MVNSGGMSTNDVDFTVAGTPVQLLPAMNVQGKQFILYNGGNATIEFSIDGQQSWMPLFGSERWVLNSWDGIHYPLWFRREQHETRNAWNVYTFQIATGKPDPRPVYASSFKL